MAVTTENTDLMTNILATPPKFNANNSSKAQFVCEVAVHTQVATGDAGSTIRICKVPQRARVLPALCHVRFTAYGAARVLKFGWEAYLKPDGTTAAADDDGFGTGLDVSGAGIAFLSGLTTPIHQKEFEGAAVLTCTCTGGTIPIGAVTSFVIVYALP